MRTDLITLAQGSKPVKSTNPLPTNDMTVCADTEIVPAEAISYEGKSVVGGRGTFAVDKNPILNQKGTNVGSYWGKRDNRVWKTGDKSGENGGKVTALVETAGSATITIFDNATDLEKLFERTTTATHILRVFDTSGNELYGFISTIAVTSDSYTIDIFSEVGLSSQDWVGTLASFDNTSLAKAEIFSYETSLTFGTETAKSLLKEVNFNPDLTEAQTLANLGTDGDFSVDYENSEVYYRRGTTDAPDTVTYKVWAVGTAAIGSVTANSDIDKLNGVDLVADNAAAPATDYPLPVGGQYNATLPTYGDGDRTVAQFNDRGKLEVTGGASSVAAEYMSPSDFKATYTSNVTITLSELPFSISDSSQIVYIKYIPTGGSGSDILVNGAGGVTITESSNVLTVNGAGTPFASGDVYEVGINAQKKGYNSTQDVDKVIDQAPLNEQFVEDELVDTTNVTAGDNYYELSMDGYKDITLGAVTSGGVTTTIEATWDDAASPDWIDITKAGYRLDDNSTDNISFVDETFALAFDNLNCAKIRVKSVTSDSTNAVQYHTKRKAL